MKELLLIAHEKTCKTWNRIWLLALLILASPNLGLSQSDLTTMKIGEAKMNSKFKVSVNIKSEAITHYKIDVSHLNISKPEDLAKLCGDISNNLLTYKPDYANHCIYLQVHFDRVYKKRELDWWNNYISNR